MSPISSPPRGMTSRATASPTRKIPYSPAAVARPSATSGAPMRMRRASRSDARARPPSTRPVAVIRSQKRARGPRKVRPNAANAAPTPSARSFTRSAGEERADDERDVEPVRGRSSGLDGEGLRAGPRVLADVTPLVPVQDRGDEQADGDARGDRA